MGYITDMYQAYDTFRDRINESCPPFHDKILMNLEITITPEGKFVRADKLYDHDVYQRRITKNPEAAKDGSILPAETNVAPVTSESCARQGVSPAPHALCDKLKYFDPAGKHRVRYMEQLGEWVSSDYSHPIAEAVYKYVGGGTVMSDLKKYKDSKTFSYTDNDMVRWRVEGLKGEDPECWKNKNLRQKYIDYQESLSKGKEASGFCHITGKRTYVCEKYPRSAIYRKHKNLSAMEFGNNAGEYFEVGQDVIDKFQASSRFLRTYYGSAIGDSTVITWCTNGEDLVGAEKPLFFSSEREFKLPFEYRKALKNYCDMELDKMEEDTDVITAIFHVIDPDKGRICVPLYDKQAARTYFDNLRKWDGSLCWADSQGNIRTLAIPYILKCAHSIVNGEEEKISKSGFKLVSRDLHALIDARIHGLPFPRPVADKIISRAMRFETIGQADVRRRIINAACAVYRKTVFDASGEEVSMMFNPDSKDRNYLFGRLLAILERIERIADINKKSSSDSKGPEPMVIKKHLQYIFRPMDTVNEVILNLDRNVFTKLSQKNRAYFRNLISDVLAALNECGEDLNKPLDPSHLVGYSLQKTDMSRKKTDEDE